MLRAILLATPFTKADHIFMCVNELLKNALCYNKKCKTNLISIVCLINIQSILAFDIVNIISNLKLENEWKKNKSDVVKTIYNETM